jgi:hypothetical protein
MNNKLHLVGNTISLTCHWYVTGDPRLPLTRVWTVKAPQTTRTASSTDATGRMHLCA